MIPAMDTSPANDALDFGRTQFDAARRRLVIDGMPAKLGARAFDVLAALVERRERVVTKDELIGLVWPNRVVEENNLQAQISALRKLLGPQAVATVVGRGYRFTLVPRSADAPGPQTVSAPPSVPNNLPAEVNRFIRRQADLTTRD